MKQYILVFEYDSKKFMDVDRIIEFKRNLQKLRNQDKDIKFIFYGNVSNEDLAVCMSYFNNLVGEKICDISLTSIKKEIIIENGINNKSIKLSAKNAKEMSNKNFNNIVKEYYSDIEALEIKLMPVKDWEVTILDL